jgi:hypothetical protein
VVFEFAFPARIMPGEAPVVEATITFPDEYSRIEDIDFVALGRPCFNAEVIKRKLVMRVSRVDQFLRTWHVANQRILVWVTCSQGVDHGLGPGRFHVIGLHFEAHY